MNCIQEGLIPLKYYEKSFERLTQANGEKLIINYKVPNVHICNDGICFETVFILIKDLSSKIILRNPFMALLYPLLMTDEGIKINVLVFKLTSPLIPKEICSLHKVTILKDINKERIYRTKGHLTEKSLDGQLIDNDIKKFKQNTETENYTNLPTTFLHRHRHIVQTSCEKDSNGKHTKDRTMLIISFSQYEWTDSVTDVPNKIIINDILTLVIVSSNTHITDVLLQEVLIKEVLIDTPLLIIKENIDCGNFLNNYRFNFLTDGVNYKSLTDFPQTIIVVDERLYYNYSYTITSREHKGVEKEVCSSIIYVLNFKNDFLIKYFKEILQKDIVKMDFKMNLKEALQRNIYFQNILSSHNDIATNPFTKSQLQTNMNKRPSKADMKGEGKAPVVQPKEIRKALAKILDKHEGVSIETISFQDTLLAEAMYSCGEKSEIQQEVLCTDLTFQDKEFADLPFHIKLLLDTFQAAFTLR